MAIAKCSIPVIDLNDFPNQSSKLVSACEEWGCFRLINHHHVLPATLMMKSVVTSLFDLPLEIKQRNRGTVVGTGYTATSPKNPLRESLGLYDLVPSSGVDYFCSQLDATPHQRGIVTRYAEAVHKLLVGIARKIVESLGVKNENFGFEDWPCQFNTNKYHFTTESINCSGIPSHTDTTFLTILQDDEQVGGLNVMDKSGKFIAVDPWPCTLIVNIGDVATLWSNGRFCNVKHRVQCKEAMVRVSIASILLGPRGIIEPLPELVDDDHPCLYVPTTYEDYRNLRISAGLYSGEALVLLHASSSR